MWSQTVLSELSGSTTASRHASRLFSIFPVNTSCWRSCASPMRVRHCSICCASFQRVLHAAEWNVCTRVLANHSIFTCWATSTSTMFSKISTLYVPMASLEGLFLGLPPLDLRATFSQTTCLFQRLEKLRCSHYQVSAHLAHQPLPRALQCRNFEAVGVCQHQNCIPHLSLLSTLFNQGRTFF